MIINRFLMFIASLSLATAMFVMTGCTKNTDPAADNKTTPATVTEFSYSAKTMTLSVGGSASVQLWAAKKAYTIQKFTDSTVLYTDSYTYLTNANYGSTGNATLYARGKKVGTSTIVIQDSIGTATVLIEVKVQTMGASPNALTLEASGSSQYVTLSGGTTPYTIKTSPVSSIATVTLGSNYLYAYPGSIAGPTSVTIKENGGDSIQIPITVVGRITFKPSSITLLAGNSATDTISGGTAPYAVYNYEATKLSAATISGSVLTVSASATAPTGYTYVSISDNSVPKLMKEVSIYITSPYLSVSTDTIRVVAGQTNSSTYVSNGTSPYSIQTAPTSTIATATMNGSYVYVTGVAAGTTSIVVKDATTPTAKTVTIPIKVTAAVTGISASVNPVSVAVSGDQQTVISGGTSPYSIQSSPSSSIATASISGATVTVHGVAAGSTSMVVKDNSSPAKTVTINITVNSGSIIFTSSGTLSFSSNVANFSATGIYNVNALTGSGAGGFLTTSSNLLVYGYKYNSSTSVDISMVEFTDASPIAAGTYVMPPITGTKSVTISYIPGLNPSSSTVTDMYILVISATATISALNTSTAQGTFSGSGLFVSNSVPDYTRTITVTNGSFNVPYLVGVSPANPADKNIESIVKKIVNSQR